MCKLNLPSPAGPVPLAFPPFPGYVGEPCPGLGGDMTDDMAPPQPDEYIAMYAVPTGHPVIIAPTEQKIFVYTTDGNKWFDTGWTHTKEDDVCIAVKKIGCWLLKHVDMVLYGIINAGTITVFDIWNTRTNSRMSVREMQNIAESAVSVSIPRVLATKRSRDIERTGSGVFCKAINDPNIVFFV